MISMGEVSIRVRPLSKETWYSVMIIYVNYNTVLQNKKKYSMDLEVYFSMKTNEK